MCSSNSHKIYVSVKHDNLLHKIMLTVYIRPSKEVIQGMSYIRVHFGIPKCTPICDIPWISSLDGLTVVNIILCNKLLCLTEMYSLYKL